MMKRQTNLLLAGLMLTSLGCGTATIKAGNNDGLVAGLCAASAALVGIAGAVALADWCCSETDDQLIARVEAQYRDVYGRYYEDMTYLGHLMGSLCQKNCWDPRSWTSSGSSSLITESVLHEFATHIWQTNSTQQKYYSAVYAAKNSLQSCVEALRKRIAKLAGKSLGYEDQQRLRKMRQLYSKSEEFLSHIMTFADILETHKSYFNLYDAIDTIRSKYFHEIMLFEAGRYATETQIKHSIVDRDNSQYAFRSFVIDIKSDISTLESKIKSLKHQYNAKRQYAYQLVDYLVAIKNIVVNDPRYQQELRAWEQAELQRMRIEAEKMRAQAERDRAQAERRQADALREQNRILAERNRIEREKLHNTMVGGFGYWNETYQEPDVNVTFDVHVTI